MSIAYFFSPEYFSIDIVQDLESIFYDAEGKFPADQLESFINNNNFDVEVFSESLVSYAVFKGTDIASQDNFFLFLNSIIGKTSPKVLFWRCYDALIRGKLAIFNALWSNYSSIELKNYKTDFVIEAIVLPEDPVFLNVTSIVHDHQQRLLRHFVVPEDNSKELTEPEFDTLLQEYIGDYSLLLSYFRILQSLFQRNIVFQDLDNLLTLLKDDGINSLGPYWECRFLATICSWKTSLGLVFDVVENINALKNLNVEASNFLIESQIFMVESQIAFKNNNIEDSRELLQSALFLAQEYGFFYQLIDVLFIKFEIDIESLSDTVERLFSLTNEHLHPLLRAKMFANLGAYYIQSKNWPEAEKNLLSASKLVQGSYDKKTYYQVVADFSYVLVATGQLHDALESCRVLLDDSVPILYRIRGFYLYSLTLLLIGQKTEAIEILEEGIRIVISFKEHISLPWFYELLELIYLSLNDTETALRYSNLTYKAYFESSDGEHGYRAKIIASFLLALQKDFGRSMAQLSSIFSDVSSTELQLETYSAILSVLLSSQELVSVNKFLQLGTFLESVADSSILKTCVEIKSNLLSNRNMNPATENIFPPVTVKNTTDEMLLLEQFFLLILFDTKKSFMVTEESHIPSTFAKFNSSLSIPFVIFNMIQDIFKHPGVTDDLQKICTDNLSNDEKNIYVSGSFFITIVRLLIDNIPFNFLTSKDFSSSK